jgi:tetratricopeptide (TPR) repeat protein
MNVLKAYERFKEYIKTENLIAYNEAAETKETALSIYRSLEGNRDANTVITSMKRELLAALQNRAQIAINNWMNSVKLIDSVAEDQVYRELRAAFKIIDSTYFQYEQIKFRYLFWSQFKEKDENNRMKILEECIAINPDEPISYLNMGVILLDQKKFNDSYLCFNKALELAKNWSVAWSNKGAVLSDLGKSEEAIKCYDKAIEIKPDLHDPWYNKGIELVAL